MNINHSFLSSILTKADDGKASDRPLDLSLLYRLALRITMNKEEAEDVVQDTVVRIWNKKDSWHEIESLQAYAATICRNIALDVIKTKQRQNKSLDDVQIECPTDDASPLEQIQQQERIALIRKHIDALPEKQKTCMQLRDFEGMSYKDIAQILSITEEQVKINIFRARKTIKENILR